MKKRYTSEELTKLSTLRFHLNHVELQLKILGKIVKSQHITVRLGGFDLPSRITDEAIQPPPINRGQVEVSLGQVDQHHIVGIIHNRLIQEKETLIKEISMVDIIGIEQL